MRIHFALDFPEDLQAIVDPLISKWKDLIPPWCQELRICYDPKRDSMMSTTLNYRNRWAVLHITGVWFKEKVEERELALVHEFVHILLEPIDAPIVRIIQDALEEGTTARELAASMHTDGSEAAVEDTAQAILRVTKK